MTTKTKRSSTAKTQPRPPLRRPWRERQPRPPRPDVVVAGTTQPLATATIYEDLVLYTRRDGRGHVRQYPISPAALAQSLSKLPSASGLLPPNTLGTGTVHGTPFYVVYVPAQRRTLRMPDRSYDIPLPPLVWAGCGQDYRIWALGEETYPTRDMPLFDPPFPNSYRDGRICWGDSDPRPAASMNTLLKVLDLFLVGSYFNLHVANNKSVAFRVSVVARWQQLVEAKADAYPLDDLIPAERSLLWLLAGGPWQGGHR